MQNKKVAQDCLSGSGVPLPGSWNQVPQPQGAPTCPLNIITFLSDPGPIFGYACHSLPHSLTDSLTHSLLFSKLDGLV